jgi:hypothetical protein
MPNLVGQLNVIKGIDGLLRVRAKFKRWTDKKPLPLLLSRSSALAKLLVLDLHKKLKHAGIYSVLSELRKEVWIPRCFSFVKKLIKTCVTCSKFKCRTVKLNQNAYRDFRLQPPNIPFRFVFLDYFGPYFIKVNSTKTKAYILCITCLWSRAINLKFCLDLSVKKFLKFLWAFQLHSFEFGLPEK